MAFYVIVLTFSVTLSMNTFPTNVTPTYFQIIPIIGT